MQNIKVLFPDLIIAHRVYRFYICTDLYCRINLKIGNSQCHLLYSTISNKKEARISRQQLLYTELRIKISGYIVTMAIYLNCI